ncbi:hypothetical protein SLE2022_105500 [Rubroshorea leprosula]
MEMDIDATSEVQGGEGNKGKQIVVVLVGAPGSGKSTFCENIMRSSSRSWARACQDTINNGKSGTKQQCISSAATALKEGKSVFIDRCNLDSEQRSDFVKFGSPQIEVHSVVLDLPAQLCISRSVKRTGHEGNLQGGKAAAVVNRMLQKKELPKLSEGFSRITFCQNESDVQTILDTYGKLGPSDTLPNGCFGQKNSDAKVQQGIMKFFKKLEVPSDVASNTSDIQSAVPSHVIEKKYQSVTHEEVKVRNEQVANVPTLAFPSISTADFQFNHEKASDIIVETIEEFMDKLGNARLVLVDLSHGSKILSLVKTKAAQRNIDSKKFFTFVGDITRLHSDGGLHCNVIANAANWRLKPGGGGVNAAIFKAAGPALEAATKERAKSLLPGNAVVVPLPSNSPLYNGEGITHVIHVLGPNMNPHRPNYLDNDYTKGCKILRDTYTSLFEGFLSVVQAQARFPKRSSESIHTEPLVSKDKTEGVSGSYFPDSDGNIKEDDHNEFEKSKKFRGSEGKVSSHGNHSREKEENRKINGAAMNKAWGSWAQALYDTAMHPEKHKDVVLETSDDAVVINDVYPKAKKHLLVLARCKGLDQLSDVCTEHLQLLKTMHAVGLKWAEKFFNEDASLVFRLGYHSDPSMRQLHLHVISQDFDSKHLKNKKHWNSFNTAFFRDSVDVIEEVTDQGKATLRDDDSLMSMELRCHRCRSAHPNIPRLKSHITNCRAPFPANLEQNNRLVTSTR